MRKLQRQDFRYISAESGSDIPTHMAIFLAMSHLASPADVLIFFSTTTNIFSSTYIYISSQYIHVFIDYSFESLCNHKPENKQGVRFNQVPNRTPSYSDTSTGIWLLPQQFWTTFTISTRDVKWLLIEYDADIAASLVGIHHCEAPKNSKDE